MYCTCHFVSEQLYINKCTVLVLVVLPGIALRAVLAVIGLGDKSSNIFLLGLLSLQLFKCTPVHYCILEIKSDFFSPLLTWSWEETSKDINGNQESDFFLALPTWSCKKHKSKGE